jgi:hypothetical protein
MPRVSSLLTLNPFHPDARGGVRALEATVEKRGDSLWFRYSLDGDMSRILVPPRRGSRHVDELWKHTCFEAFVARGDGSGQSGIDEYRELNFSPSTEWAAYAFNSYRQGMRPVALQPAPEVSVESTGESLNVITSVDMRSLLPPVSPETRPTLRIALTAVIEDDRGAITYWALKHAPDKPDFHHPAGFILEV